MLRDLPKRITRSLSNISSIRESTTTKMAAAAASEVANAELSCYGVFRKLEPDDHGGGGGGSGGGGRGGGGERVIAAVVGRPPRPPRDGGRARAFSPQEPALAYATATTTTTQAAADRDPDPEPDDHGYREPDDHGCYREYDGRRRYSDDDDDDLFEPGTYSVYDCSGGSSSCCDAKAAPCTDTTTCSSSAASASDATNGTGTGRTRTTTTTTGPPPPTAGRRSGREPQPVDFGAAAVNRGAWEDDCDSDCFGGGYRTPQGTAAAATAHTRTVVVGGAGAAGSPFSHTPMGSTTKLVGVDANGDDAPKIYCCKSKCLQSFGTLLMTISLTVSLANIIRLPRMVFLYGGGTFLLSYLIVAIVFGVPLLFLEITLGQFCQQGTTKLWRAVPLLKGVGFVKVLASMLLAAYYPIIMALSLFYGTRSIIGSIPFPECSNSINFFQFPNSHFNSGEECLQQTFTKPPHLNWQWIAMDVLLILLIWIVVAISLIKNSKSYRTAALLVVPTTFVTIAVLLAKGLNANQLGLEILLDIKWETFLKLDIWYHAVVHFFFTTHLGFGNITTCAGRLYSKSNPFWTSVMLTVVSIIVGVSSVSIVTMWIYDMQQSGVVMSNSSASSEVWFLTFVYELTVKRILTDMWATLVFAMVFLSGFLSLIAATYTAVVGLSVETKEKWKWWILTCTVCFIGFLVGVLCLLPENLQAVHLLDEYIIGRMVVTSTVLELIGFVWIYGLESLSNDFEFVLGYKLCFAWKFIWMSTPVLFMLFEFWNLFVMPLTESDYSSHDSMWLYVIGWIVYLFMWSLIIGIAVWQISAQVDYNFSQKFLSTIKPSRNWGPVDPIYRHCWVQWKKQYQVTGERDFTLRRRGTRDYTHSIKRGKHAAPPGTAYSISPTSLDRTSSCYSIGASSPQHQRPSADQHLRQFHYNHAMNDQRRWNAAEPKSSGGTSINYM